MPIHPYGALLAYSTDDINYTSFTGLTVSLTPPNLTRGAAQTTTLDAASQVRTWIASWKESGEIPFKMQFGRANFTTLLSQWNSNTQLYYRITFPLEGSDVTNSTLKAVGFLRDLGFDEMTVDGDNVIHNTGAIKLSGPVTFTAGS